MKMSNNLSEIFPFFCRFFPLSRFICWVAVNGFKIHCIQFCLTFKPKHWNWFLWVFCSVCSRAAYVSFGGLLMRLQGDANNLHGFEVDSHVYLLMKKLAFWLVGGGGWGTFWLDDGWLFELLRGISLAVVFKWFVLVVVCAEQLFAGDAETSLI